MITNFGIAPLFFARQQCHMIDTDELLARLEAKKVRNVDIARALGLPDSRIPEIKKKERKLSFDEGATLVRVFELEPAQAAQALPISMLRLAVRHIARSLDTDPSDERVAALAADLRAFLRYAATPRALGSEQATRAFFEALLLRQEDREEEAPQEKSPDLSS